DAAAIGQPARAPHRAPKRPGSAGAGRGQSPACRTASPRPVGRVEPSTACDALFAVRRRSRQGRPRGGAGEQPAAAARRRAYGDGPTAVVALREATFEAARGDRIAVVGPSGSGKTTLLHLMAALDVPTEGRIEWPALGPREALRPSLLGVAFQGPSLLPPLT